MTDVPAVPPPPTPPAPASGQPAYPIELDFERDLAVQNWRPLVNWLLAIPQWIVLYALGIVAGVLWFISLFAVLFTTRNPFVNIQSMILRYQWRVVTFTLYMRNEYPPFDFTTTAADNGIDAARVGVEDPGDMNRWLPLVKWLLVIPHLVVLFFLYIAVFVVHVIAFFAVLFTGKWPGALREFVIGVTRWATRVNGYTLFLTDAYPPFRLEP